MVLDVLISGEEINSFTCVTKSVVYAEELRLVLGCMCLWLIRYRRGAVCLLGGPWMWSRLFCMLHAVGELRWPLRLVLSGY